MNRSRIPAAPFSHDVYLFDGRLHIVNIVVVTTNGPSWLKALDPVVDLGPDCRRRRRGIFVVVAVEVSDWNSWKNRSRRRRHLRRCSQL